MTPKGKSFNRAISTFAAVIFVFSLFSFGAHQASASTTVIYLTSGTTWTVPSDWNNASNSIEVIGGGGGGENATGIEGSGGGGGGYSKISNLSLTPNASVSIAVGAGGANGAPATAGGDTYVNGTSCASASVCAKGGTGGSDYVAGAGGAAASGVGTVKFSGGTGGLNFSASNGGAGGGGAAGPFGNGGNGGTVFENSTNADGSGGGGGNGGGGNGLNAIDDNNGGAGGAAQDGTPGGTGGASTTPDGGNGSHGSGGGGGYGIGTGPTGIGGAGGNGVEWDATHGSGGGGAGGGSGNIRRPGGAGGLYGGGGGGGPWSAGIGASGAQGIIVISYTPIALALSPVTVSSNNASTSLAKVGDVITATFTGSLALHAPTVSILGHASTTAINTSGNTWSASTTVQSGDTQGAISFLINAPNSAQTATTTASAVTSGATVTIDTLPPTITLSGGDASVSQNAAYTDPGATATDAHDGAVSVTTTGSVDTSKVGTYTLTYTAIDAAGNTSSKTRTVTVTSSGGGGIVGLVGMVGTFKGPGYVAPRPQIVYPDGRVVYLDTPTNTQPSNTQPSQTTNPQPSPNSAPAPTFTANLQMYDRSSDILLLQQYLNTHGYPLATTGPGSAGQETDYFGALTYKALVKFQQAHGLPATGYFGPLTRTVTANLNQVTH